MRLKAKLLFLCLASFLGAAQGESFENDFGIYSTIKPQSTCESIGEGWRVPQIEELFNTPSALIEKSEKLLYASSTKNPKNSEEIYYYSFENRDVNLVLKNESLNLICIKPKKQENKKSLSWGKTEQNRMNFKEAKEFCEAKGSRLPNAKELFSLAIFKVFNEKEYAQKYGFTQPKYYWSSDANDDFSNTAIVVGFLRASVASSAKDNKSFVRCVLDAK
jgi:hypothetical protein